MPTQANLDDRDFDSLVREGVSLLPFYAPQWTNHNASDPGITLIELLAYVCESMLFRMNRIGRDSKLGFLQLLCGADYDRARFEALDTSGIDAAIAETVASLSTPARAVTTQDFELLAHGAASRTFGVPARVFCAAGVRIAKGADGVRVIGRPADFTAVVLRPRDRPVAAAADDLRSIGDQLRPYCLLGSRAHVVDAVTIVLSVGVTISTGDRLDRDAWLERIGTRLDRYFSPYAGDGPHPLGWPFGRAVYGADVFEALADLEGVDDLSEVRILHASIDEEVSGSAETAIGLHVGIEAAVSVTTRFGAKADLGGDRLIVDEDGQLTGFALKPYELVKVVIAPDGLKLDAGSDRYSRFGDA